MDLQEATDGDLQEATDGDLQEAMGVDIQELSMRQTPRNLTIRR